MLVSIDPLEKYPDHDHTHLMSLCGWLPGMIEEAFTQPETSMESIVRALGEAYQFELIPMSGSVTPEGVYTYDGDPDLYPIALIQHRKHPDITIYIYLYGIVAIVKGDEQYLTRMD